MMKIENLLTIVIPIKGRHKLARRLLDNLELQGCKFQIILSDGSDDNHFEKIYESNYKSGPLNLKYFWNGKDLSIDHYISKLKKSIEMVHTPFCIFIDDDDFIDIAGIKYGIKFLYENPDYFCYQNDVQSIMKVDGLFRSQRSLYTKDSIEQENSTDRVLDVIKSFNSFSYAIYKTKEITLFFSILDEAKNNDFQLFMKGWAYFSALSGKCKREHDASYYYFIPGNSILQNNSQFFKFSQWLGTGDKWEKSLSFMIAMVEIFDVNPELFAKSFIQEVFEANNIRGVDPDKYYEQFNKIPMSEKFYDYCSSFTEKLVFDFSLPEEIKNIEKPKRKDFIQWLNTL